MGQGWKGPRQEAPSPAAARGWGAAAGSAMELHSAPLPSPAALLSFCTSTGNVPLTYIFFQTYMTFFFPL